MRTGTRSSLAAVRLVRPMVCLLFCRPVVEQQIVGGKADGPADALLHHCGSSLSGIGGELRPGIVHRIDRDTSGLIIAAKNDAAHQALSAQLQDHTLARTYEAVVVGNLREDRGTVDAPIGRHHTDRKKMAVTDRGGRRAGTPLSGQR